MRWLSQSSVRTQIAILTALLAAVVTTIAAGTEPFVRSRFDKGVEVGLFAGRIETITKEFALSTDKTQGDAVLSRFRAQGVNVWRAAGEQTADPPVTARDIPAAVRRLLDYNIFFDPYGFMGWNNPKTLTVSAGDGSLVFALPEFSTTRWILPAVFGKLVLIIVPAAVLAILTAWLIGRPIVDLAIAAERVRSDDELDEPFEVSGSAELRSLATSLNLMRKRVRELMAGRTRMLTSISHDLRTPLTRLRMRAERCDRAELRQQMLRDIDVLSSMINESLAYLGGEVEALKKVELSSLLQTVTDDFADTGIDVTFTGPRRLPYICKPRALSRAVSNLIDNASRHAGSIDLALVEEEDGSVVITVADNGPGIADELKLQVMEPFFKADKARSTSKNSGFGLGLSIAHGIITVGHRGSFELRDRKPHGLAVVIRLPANSGIGNAAASS
ncbi:putative transmembrane two-component sensor histidine kinase transcriptional regulatory protein [Rhizobium freirei PRF 81]|uniref:histidine kinase n=1 Tax=Rhizobium freirei PRF 81 TaxID=363754 RepID=N6V7E1_9HYPH|nr:ATP-binding protein [Rhizobium freirei]ENN89755.1 putative transmembrane two-component sensor histidine kinase transcriptional regulatory protein [Rhizobium freirei PRF 81]